MNAVFCGSQALEKPPKSPEKRLRSLDVDLSLASLKLDWTDFRLRLVSATSVVVSCASKKSPEEDAKTDSQCCS